MVSNWNERNKARNNVRSTHNVRLFQMYSFGMILLIEILKFEGMIGYLLRNL